MKNYLKFCLILLFCIPSLLSSAQDKSVLTKVKKFKPPVVQTMWDKSKNDAKISKVDAVKMLYLPIKIVDSGNHNYTVDSYGFLYRSKSMVDNDQTGKKEVLFTITGDKFIKTPLSKVWIDNIKDNLQPDEQFIFFDVLAKDEQGRIFSAPDLKITIQ